MQKIRFTMLAALVVGAAASRLIPHPPNFTPIAALALFGGATFSDKRIAVLLPLAAMALSDVILGFSWMTPVIYASFVLITCLGFLLRRQSGAARIAGASVAGAVLFFVVTNAAVWLGGGLYPKTLEGLGACYIAALPFFGNTLGSDLLYTALLFGVVALAEQRWPALRVPEKASVAV